jgi:hypothetical protein
LNWSNFILLENICTQKFKSQVDGSSIICSQLGYQIKEDKLDRTCSTYERNYKFGQFGGCNWRIKDQYEDSGGDGRLVLK